MISRRQGGERRRPTFQYVEEHPDAADKESADLEMELFPIRKPDTRGLEKMFLPFPIILKKPSSVISIV
jgi:hypothetical protein